LPETGIASIEWNPANRAESRARNGRQAEAEAKARKATWTTRVGAKYHSHRPPQTFCSCFIASRTRRPRRRTRRPRRPRRPRRHIRRIRNIPSGDQVLFASTVSERLLNRVAAQVLQPLVPLVPEPHGSTVRSKIAKEPYGARQPGWRWFGCTHVHVHIAGDPYRGPGRVVPAEQQGDRARRANEPAGVH
jgi:hypothetical protein